MTKYKCLIVDDEELAIEAVEDHLSKLENFVIVGRSMDAIDAINQIKSYEPDLIFLDIEMPQMTGLELIRSLKHPPKIILITAYRNYAVEAFDLDVIDYLLKPISFERFMRSVNRFYDCLDNNDSIELATSQNKDPFIKVVSDRKTFKVKFSEILYIESFSDYIIISCVSRKLMVRKGISEFEQSLPEKLFLRIHRSYIVSLSKIDSFSKEVVEIKGNELPISRKYKDRAHKLLFM